MRSSTIIRRRSRWVQPANCMTALCRKAVAFLVIVAVYLTQVPNVATVYAFEPADDWKAAVDQLIPLSFSLAKYDAYVRENDVFIKSSGQAQSYLTHAIDRMEAAETIEPLLLPRRSLQNNDGSINLDRTLDQLIVLAQLADAHNVAEHSISQFETISKDRAHACDSMTVYRVDATFLDPTPPRIETMDGTFIVVIPTDPASTIVSAVVSAVVSAYEIWKNSEQQEKIESDAKRLERERAQDAYYQDQAAIACKTLAANYDEYFALYSKLSAGVSDWLKQTEDIVTIQADVRKLVDTFTTEEVAARMADSRRRVRAKSTLFQANYALRIQLALLQQLRNAQDILSADPCDVTATMHLHDIALSSASFGVPDANVIAQRSATLVLRTKARCRQRSPRQIAVQAPLHARLLIPSNMLRSLARLPQDTSDSSQRPLLLATEHEIPANGIAATQPCSHFSITQTLCESLYSGTSLIRQHTTGYYSTNGGGLGAAVSDINGTYQYESEAVTLSYSPSRPWYQSRQGVGGNIPIPGFATARQAVGETNRINAFVSYISAKSAQLHRTADALASSNANYRTTTLPIAANRTLSRIGVLISHSANTVGTVAKTYNQVERPHYPLENVEPLASDSLRRLNETLGDAKGQAERWKALQVLTSTAAMGAELPISAADRESLKRMHDAYFDGVGILRGVSPITQQSSTEISRQLQTAPLTAEGRSVRDATNKGLLALDVAGIRQQEAVGGLSMVVAADQAYSSGAAVSGDRLMKVGLASIDFALGFVPFLGSVNDALQIVHGMVTGTDYAGRSMSSADYALRGLGVLLGIVPFAKLGGLTLSASFFGGAAFLRETALGARFGALFQSGRSALVRGTTAIGLHVSEGMGQAQSIAALRSELDGTIAVMERAAGHRADPEAPEAFARLLELTDPEGAFSLVKSFDLRTIELDVVLKNEIAYRWHNADNAARQFGRYFSTDLIEDRTIARELLHLPEANKMIFLDEFSVQPGTAILRGKAILKDGIPGAPQIYLITKSPEGSIQIVKRLIPPPH